MKTEKVRAIYRELLMPRMLGKERKKVRSADIKAAQVFA
jgi:hypothetical protein